MDETQQFLSKYPPEIQTLTGTLRALVKRTMPKMQEVLYASQNHFGYSFSDKASERVVYICPLKDYVRLGFMYGGELDDPEHLLQGEGKRLRHIKARTLQQAKTRAVKTLLQAAYANARSERVNKK